METSVRENLRAKICFGALKNSRWGYVVLFWCSHLVLPSGVLNLVF
jgi:hypothetical protein